VKYTIDRRQHGVVISGSRIPIEVMQEVISKYKGQFPIASLRIAAPLGAIMVLVSRESALAWERELGILGE